MSPYERTIAALRRQKPDRVPIFSFTDETSPAASEPFRRYLASHADVFYTRVLHTGFHCTGLALERTENALEDGWREATCRFEGRTSFTEIYKDGENADYRGYRKHQICSRADIERILDLPYIPPAGNPHLAAWMKEIEEFAEGHCAAGAFFRIAFLGPLGTLAGEVSPEDFALLALEEEEAVGRYLALALERQAEYLGYVLENLHAPAIMNIGGAEYAIPPLMGPTAFDKYITPYDGKLIQLMHEHGRLVYYHCHGKVRRFLPSFIHMKADGIHPLEPVGTTGDCDLAEVKQTFGKEICLIGNIQYDDLVRLSASEVESKVRETVRAAREGGGFILSPSCTPYHNPMPPSVERNLTAFIEAGLASGAE
jgi:hypothetical protein